MIKGIMKKDSVLPEPETEDFVAELRSRINVFKKRKPTKEDIELAERSFDEVFSPNDTPLSEAARIEFQRGCAREAERIERWLSSKHAAGEHTDATTMHWALSRAATMPTLTKRHSYMLAPLFGKRYGSITETDHVWQVLFTEMVGASDLLFG